DRARLDHFDRQVVDEEMVLAAPGGVEFETGDRTALVVLMRKAGMSALAVDPDVDRPGGDDVIAVVGGRAGAVVDHEGNFLRLAAFVVAVGSGEGMVAREGDNLCAIVG